MALSKSTITGRVPLPTDENMQFAELTFALSGLDTEGADVLPGGISTRIVLIDSDIPPGFELWQNMAGLHGTHYRVLARWTVKDRDGIRDQYADLGVIQIGSDPSYTLADLINNGVAPAIGTFWSAITQAQYDAVIQSAADAAASAVAAAASAVAAALYDGPKADTIAIAKTVTAGMVPVGGYLQIRDIGAVWQRAPDATPVVDGYPLQFAGGPKWFVVDTPNVSTDAFAATYVGDESVIARAMLEAFNVLRVPKGKTLTCKNVALKQGSTLDVQGALKLPNLCADNDKIIYANGKQGLNIYVNDLDGNFSGQSGNIGTHLLYLVGCDDANVHIRSAHDHFISGGAPMPDTLSDGRNVSSGAIWLSECKRADAQVDSLIGWGREGLMFNNAVGGTMALGYSLGTKNTEYSSLQANGSGVHLRYAHSEYAGASAVGWDVIGGTGGNITVKNCRANYGLNMGHPGYPATGSVLSNIVVDGVWGGGIRIGSNSQDAKVSNFTIIDAEYGLQASDGVEEFNAVNGKVLGVEKYQAQVSVSKLGLTAVSFGPLDPRVIRVTGAVGEFAVGETVTSGASSGVVRRVVKGLPATTQRIYLSTATGTFPNGAITGGTSGATATVSASFVPAKGLEQGGGLLFGDSWTSDTLTGMQTRFPDGTAIYRFNKAVVCAAGVTKIETIAYSAGVVWADNPIVTAVPSSYNATSAFVLSYLVASSTTAELKITMKSDVAQTYGIGLIAMGRWR